MNLFKSLITLLIVTVAYGCSNTKSVTAECNCNLVPDKGNCRAMITKYYFDKEEGKCKEFIWGGCEGTVPFETLEECEACKCEKE